MDCGADVGRIPTVTICEKFQSSGKAQAMDVTLVCGPDLCPGPLIVLLTPSLPLSLQIYTFGHQREYAKRRDVQCKLILTAGKKQLRLRGDELTVKNSTASLFHASIISIPYSIALCHLPWELPSENCEKYLFKAQICGVKNKKG